MRFFSALSAFMTTLLLGQSAIANTELIPSDEAQKSVADLYKNLTGVDKILFDDRMQDLVDRRKRISSDYDKTIAIVEAASLNSEIALQKATSLRTLYTSFANHVELCTQRETRLYDAAASGDIPQEVVEYYESAMQTCYDELNSDSAKIADYKLEANYAQDESDKFAKIAEWISMDLSTLNDHLQLVNAQIRELQTMGVGPGPAESN